MNVRLYSQVYELGKLCESAEELKKTVLETFLLFGLFKPLNYRGSFFKSYRIGHDLGVKISNSYRNIGPGELAVFLLEVEPSVAELVRPEIRERFRRFVKLGVGLKLFPVVHSEDFQPIELNGWKGDKLVALVSDQVRPLELKLIVENQKGRRSEPSNILEFERDGRVLHRLGLFYREMLGRIEENNRKNRLLLERMRDLTAPLALLH